MRIFPTILCSACLALAAPVAGAVTTWLAHEQGVSQVVGNQATQIEAINGVRILAATHDGGAWAMGAARLVRLSGAGAVSVDIDLVASAYGQGVSLAVDPYDDSVWVATDTRLLLHLSSDGALVQGTLLPAVADALNVAFDQNPWFLMGGELVHFSGNAVSFTGLSQDTGAAGTAAELAIDSLRGHAWIAGSRTLSRIATDRGAPGVVPEVVFDAPRAIALDVCSGELWTIVDTRLLAIDRDGTHRIVLDLPTSLQHDAVALRYDYDRASVLLQIPGRLARIAGDGRILEESPLPPGAFAASPPPLRVDPALALIRPPAGAATFDRSPDLTLRVSALCNGTPCDLQAAYARDLRILATINGVAASDAIVDAGTGKAVVVPRIPMRPGQNRLIAQAVDRFGHHTELAAVLTVLEREPDPNAPAQREQPRDRDDRPNAILKAPNKAPVASLTSPANGATFSSGTTITLAATASDPDGAVTRVEFYRGGATLIGTAATAPYQVVWQNAAAGNYALTARAYDNRNGTATSTPVTIAVTDNQPPAVAVTSPAQGAFFASGTTVQLVASASDPDGAVARVEFFDGSVPIGVASTVPFAMPWVAASPGVHSIVALAIDDRGTTSQPQSIDIIVGQAPWVVVKSPAACSSLDGPLDLILAADALSTTGTIARVEFFDGDILVGTSDGDPWLVVLTAATPGNHSITARAIDDRGLAATSRPSVVTVRTSNQPPSVSLVSPGEGARFAPGSTVSLSANAHDSDGSVVAVEYRIGGIAGSLIGRSASAPYAVAWTIMAAGNYTLVAVAFDDRNATATSTPVHVTVAANAPPSVTLTAPAPDARFAAPATIALGANASDTDGAIARVDFHANGTLVGTSTAVPYAAIWDNVSGGTYSVTATAFDTQSAVATSSPAIVVVESNATISVSDGLDGSTVDDDTVVVSGIINAPANSGVLVNGIVAQVDVTGHFYANGVPLSPGANALTITATSQDGQVATQTIGVSSSGSAPFGVAAAPTDGLAPLRVTYRIENRTNRSFERIEFDFDGDGSTDYIASPAQFTEGVFTLIVTYPAGTASTRVTVYDPNDVVIQSTARTITARTLEQQDILLQGIYNGMVDRLRTGNLALAMTAITPYLRDKYGQVFTTLGPGLPAALESLGTLEPGWFRSDHAEYWVIRETPEGQQAFLLDFIRAHDGIWRIDGM